LLVLVSRCISAAAQPVPIAAIQLSFGLYDITWRWLMDANNRLQELLVQLYLGQQPPQPGILGRQLPQALGGIGLPEDSTSAAAGSD
jgi:hypothetical protein